MKKLLICCSLVVLQIGCSKSPQPEKEEEKESIAEPTQLSKIEVAKDTEPQMPNLVQAKCGEAISEDDQMAHANDNNAFAISMYRELASEIDIVFSPYSIREALSLVYLGAKNTTAQTLKTGLKISNDKLFHVANCQLRQKLEQQSSVTVSVANALWRQSGVELITEYKEQCLNWYGSTVASVNFSAPKKAAKIINDWVLKQTEQKIEKLVSPEAIRPNTELLLTNAVYFKGTWKKHFKKNETKPEPWYLLDGSVKAIPTMHAQEKVLYANGENARSIALPYDEDTMSMLIVLPKENDGLKNVSTWSDEEWNKLLNPDRLFKVLYNIPRFKITFGSVELKQTLTTLGMGQLFKGGDFSGMVSGSQWFITSVLHKAFIEVNEEGTEAAASTAVRMARGMGENHMPITFKADHPFIFAIKDNTTGAILFMGQVVTP